MTSRTQKAVIITQRPNTTQNIWIAKKKKKEERLNISRWKADGGY